MPELAEVEFYRKQWDCGLGERVVRVKLHTGKRIYRGVPVLELRRRLPGAAYVWSEARGKQMLLRFGDDLWLGLHLGMSGKLRVEARDFRPGRHDHLVLYQQARALVFTDPRLFGRVRFHAGADCPGWWAQLPPAVNSSEYTRLAMDRFLERHRKLPIKAALLLQTGFPGIGNWMADEILWRARIHPRTTAVGLSKQQKGTLWRKLRLVARVALARIGRDFSDPPKGWLFHERWREGGRCPVHTRALDRATIGGRTTVWCRECQG
jgi:formamidopyrimidine-DNA glycosylase